MVGVKGSDEGGCPFASMRANDLETLLKNIHVGSDSISNIMDYYRDKHYDVELHRWSDW